MADETAWLIEHMDRYPVPKWLLPGITTQWTTDAFKALRFATEDEARAVIRHPDFDLYKISWPTEHIFADSQSDSPASGEVNDV